MTDQSSKEIQKRNIELDIGGSIYCLARYHNLLWDLSSTYWFILGYYSISLVIRLAGGYPLWGNWILYGIAYTFFWSVLGFAMRYVIFYPEVKRLKANLKEDYEKLSSLEGEEKDA